MQQSILWVPLDRNDREITFGEGLKLNAKSCEVREVTQKSTISVKCKKLRKLKEYKGFHKFANVLRLVVGCIDITSEIIFNETLSGKPKMLWAAIYGKER